MAQVKHNPRALADLRADGWYAVSVDHWDSFTRRSKDLFGIFDILALKGSITLGLQVTSRSNMAARRRKIQESEVFENLIDARWRSEVWGYDQPNGPRTAWRVKKEIVT